MREGGPTFNPEGKDGTQEMIDSLEKEINDLSRAIMQIRGVKERMASDSSTVAVLDEKEKELVAELRAKTAEKQKLESSVS